FAAGGSWVGGGLRGVGLFFVLWVFLVPARLVSERARPGPPGLRRFGARRARRLLPALVVLLVAVCLYSRWVSSGIAPRQLRGDALSTLAYVANWNYIASGHHYFLHLAPPAPLATPRLLLVHERLHC